MQAQDAEVVTAENFGDVAIYANSAATVYAVITINGASAGQNDVVGAYVGTELRNKATVVIYQGAAYLSLRMNSAGGDETFTFKVYDDSAKLVYPVPSISLTVGPGSTTGPSPFFEIKASGSAPAVADTTAPVITLTGSASVSLELGATYTDAGATADGGEAVTTSGTVNVNTAGVYTLTYSASDASGNAATSVTRTVTVTDTTAPVITLSGSAAVAHEFATTYTDAGATADSGETVTTTGTVDVNTHGVNTLTYSVTDASGNAATTVTRTVTVVPPLTIKTHPVSYTKSYRGHSVVLSVEATGTNLTYQWQRGGQAFLDGPVVVLVDGSGNEAGMGGQTGAIISGATTATLMINEVNTDDSAIYKCVVSDNFGSITSNASRLEVSSEPAFSVVNNYIRGMAASSVAWGDYDSDGYLDLLVTGQWDSYRYSDIYRNRPAWQGDGRILNWLSDPGLNERILLSGVDRSSSSWGDYDNDGDLDILLTGAIDGSDTKVSKIYRNDGGNSFVELTNISLPGIWYGSSAWGDFDNDNDLDIILTGRSDAGSLTRIYRNNGSDSFSAVTGLNLTQLQDGSVAWGDYDNDGDLDLIITGVEGNANRCKIYRNDGSDSFVDIEASLAGAVSYGNSVAWGDYDSDGDLDVLLTGNPDTAKVYRNDGNDIFVDIKASMTGVHNSSADWGDFDGDGDLDILVTGEITKEGPDPLQPFGDYYTSRIYINNGGDSFTFYSGNTLTGIYDGSAVWGDYDNDGDLDIAMAGAYWMEDQNRSGYTAKIYRNDLPDTSPPVITLNGSSVITHGAGIPYTEEGARAIDARDGKVKITTSGLVDFNKIGTYTLSYTATDAAGNTGTSTRAVTVTTPPSLQMSLSGDKFVLLDVGDTFSDPGAFAIDVTDGTLEVTTTGSVDTSKPGTYLLTYTANNSAGSIATKTRLVTVLSPKAELANVEGFSGLVAEDKTLSRANSPYLVTKPVLVEAGVRLTIEAGVEVMFEQDTYLRIQGELIARGDANRPIRFSSYKDTPAKGDWGYILLEGTKLSADEDYNYLGGAIFQHCIVEYSDTGIKFRDSAEAHIEECRFRENNNGITFNHMVNSNIRKSYFFNNKNGLYAEYYTVNGKTVIRVPSYSVGALMKDCVIEYNEFYSNTSDAIFAGTYRTSAVSNLFQNNTIRDNGGWGLYGRYGDSGTGFSNNTIKDNAICNNTKGGIHFGDIGNLITGNKILNNGIGISSNGAHGPSLNELEDFVEPVRKSPRTGWMDNVISNNVISGNEKGILYAGMNLYLTVENNILIDNTQSLLVGMPSNPHGQRSWPPADGTYMNNIISSVSGQPLIEVNKVDEPNWSGGHTFSNNKLISDSEYKVINRTPEIVSMRYNDWGVADISEIPNLIYDYYDDFDLGKVEYAPVYDVNFHWGDFYVDFIPKATPIMPPYDLSGEMVSGGIQLEWKALQSDRIKEYKVYFDTEKSGWPYAFSRLTGSSDTSFTIDNLATDRAYYFAVSAIGTDGTETWLSDDEQHYLNLDASHIETHGSESWVSDEIYLDSFLILVNGQLASSNVKVANKALVEIKSGKPEDWLTFYTLDGSEPDFGDGRQPELYTVPFEQPSGATIKAIAYGPEYKNFVHGPTVELLVLKSQELSVEAPQGVVYGAAPVALVGSSDSGLPVSFEVTDGPGKVEGGKLVPTGAGLVKLRAKQAGNDEYASAELLFLVAVAMGTQEITWEEVPAKTYGDGPFNVSASSSIGLPVSYEVVSGPATIEGAKVTLTGGGTVVLKASHAGNANLYGAEALKSIVVSKVAQTITFGYMEPREFTTDPIKLEASSSSGLSVVYEVMVGPATVFGDEMTLIDVGEVTIRAKHLGNASYLAASAVDRTFKVVQGSQSVEIVLAEQIAWQAEPVEVGLKASSGLKAFELQVLSGPAQVVNGTSLKLTGVGVVKLILSEPGDARYGSAMVQKDVTVVKASQAIEFEALPGQIGFHAEPIELRASASSGLEVDYEVVSTHKVFGEAWRLGSGEVESGKFVLPMKGLLPQTVTVKAIQSGSEVYNAAESVERSFELVRGSDVLEFEPIGNRLVEGGDVELEASAASGLNPIYSLVDGPAVLSQGKLKLIGTEGKVTVRAKTMGSPYYLATEVEQSFEVKQKGWIALETMSGGTVELDPEQELYERGTVVKLTPKPGEGYEFAGWSGELDGTTSPRSVTVNAPMRVGAKFKDVAGPVVTLVGPAAGTTSSGTFSLGGSVSDNAGVAGASWSLNGKDQGKLELNAGIFTVSGLKLDYGANLIKVSAGDEAGNVGTASVEVKWAPERTLKIGTVLERQEGQVVEIPIELESQGGVSSMTFVLKYDPVYLAEPQLLWSSEMVGVLNSVNTKVTGELKCAFSLGDKSVSSGARLVAKVAFRVRSIPEELESKLGLEVLEMADTDGDTFVGSTTAVGGEAKLQLRRVKGDNNGNDKLDVGDGTVMLRMLTDLEEVREWDVGSNDLNENTRLDSGDVTRVLKTSVGLVGKTALQGTKPRIMTHPRSRVMSAGQTYVFRTQATGTQPITYQWYRNGQEPISD
ncbi:DUF5011 domain-containing protein [Verrucomicrobia bacterium]|nr:DUF5011 domain-containing protein [Verrucomicrobiota bacterium]